MRGYAPTEVPRDECYGLGALAADAIALHDALEGNGDAVLIGHDWGAETAYTAAAFAPERWRRLVTLAIPPLAMDDRLFSDYDQLRRFFYISVLRGPRAVALVQADGMAFIERLWADWSPGYAATEDLRAVKECLAEPANLAAAIAYYSGDRRGALERCGQFSEQQEAAGRQPPMPTLYLHGSADGCIAIELVRDAERFLAPGSRMGVVEGVGHFLQVERPDAVNGAILEWVRG